MNDHAHHLSHRPTAGGFVAFSLGWLSTITVDHFCKFTYLIGGLIAIGYSLWKWTTEAADRRRRLEAEADAEKEGVVS